MLTGCSCGTLLLKKIGLVADGVNGGVRETERVVSEMLGREWIFYTAMRQSRQDGSCVVGMTEPTNNSGRTTVYVGSRLGLHAL